jgi:putative salt-induced outer membrane protein YdiY
MRLRRLPPLLALFFPALMLSAPGHADEIELTNGDRITGRIVSKAGNELVVRTDYAGELRLRWDLVKSLRTSEPVTVMTAGGDLLNSAQLAASEADKVALSNPSTEGNVKREDIAFINPTPEQSGNGVSYSGRVNMSAALVRGNAENDRIYGDGALDARAKGYAWGLGMKVDRRKDRGVKTAQQWLLNGNYDHFVNERQFIYARTSFEQDKIKDIQLRTTVGAGYGWQIFEDEQTRLSLRTGLDYVNVDRIVSRDDDYPALGWGVRASHWLLDRRAELFHDQDGFWSIADTQQLTIRSKTGVRLPIAAGMTASAQLNADWERTPAPGRKAVDSTLLLGLGYAW